MEKKILRALNIIFILCILIIAVAEGFINPFILWNIIPLIIGYIFIRRAVKKIPNKKGDIWPAACFCLISSGYIVFYHIAWLFNWGSIATGSSTSGLIFIFIPIYASAGGIIGFLAGLLGKIIYSRLKRDKK